jgi:hypothetical protein
VQVAVDDLQRQQCQQRAQQADAAAAPAAIQKGAARSHTCP